MNPIHSGRRRWAERGDEGEALLIVIVFLLIFALMLPALLSGIGVNLNMTAVTRDQGQLQYAADAGIEWGINQLEQSGSECNSGTHISGTPFYPVLGNPGKTDGSTPFQITNAAAGNLPINTNVYCEPITGLGSGVFGGYSVVTGMNYPNTPGYPNFTSGYGSQEYAGTQTCTSFSGDPVKSGSATYASNVGSTSTSSPECLTYPGNPWTDSDFAPDDNGTPITPGNVNQAFAIDATDIYAVGAPVVLAQSGAGTITNPSGPNWFITSSALFTGSANFMGSTITDTAGAIPINTTVNMENNTGGTVGSLPAHSVTVNHNPTSTEASDTFTLSGSTTAGGIYHFDGGDDFSYVGAGAPAKTLTGVWAPQGDPNHVWVVGAAGTILYCNANCTNESATWTPENTGTQDLTAITGTSTTALYAVGADGTLLSSANGTTWTTSGGPASGPGTIACSGMPSTCTISSGLFTGSANYVNWTITDTKNAFGAGGAVIKSETNGSPTGTVTVMPTPNMSQASDTFTVTPPAGNLATSFNSVYADSSGNVWAAGAGSGGGGAGVIKECPNCNPSAPNWVNIAIASPPNTYSSIIANGSSLWAVGGSSVSVCASTCGTASHWSTYTPANAGTLTDIVAADPTDVWMITSSGGGTPIMYCTASCNTSGASWTTQSIDDPEGTLNTLTAVPAILRSDTATWSGSVFVAGNVPAANNGTGWATFGRSSNTGSFLMDLKGGSVLNGGVLNVATPVEIQNGQFVQYATSTCPPKPGSASLEIVNGGANAYQCVTASSSAAFQSNSLLNPLLNVDEPLPSEAAGGLAACVKITNGCTDQSNTAIKVNPPAPYKASCPSFTEYFPGYYSNLMVNTGGGGTSYFASGVYYINGAGGALDNGAYVIGGQPGPGDPPTVVTNSPCWQYISNNWQYLDSPSTTTGIGHLGAICGNGTTQCAWPSGTWYEGVDTGGGATTSPNGTGVSWVLGNKAAFDVHTVNMELFTREVPDYLSSGTGFGPTGSKTIAQEKNEGTFGVTIREVPPQCPSSVTTQTTGFTDGAIHPGPYCVLVSSGWTPLSAGQNQQTLQIDANGHNPFVYIHGAIYMPDNNMTLFTNQPQQDVWVGALDVNSLEMTFDTKTSPPIQIIGGGSPQVVSVELIAQAQDPGSNTTAWEEAVIKEPPLGATQTGTTTGTASTTSGSSASTLTSTGLFSGSANYVGFTVTGGGIPANTTITSENNVAGTAQLSNPATSTNTNETVTLSPIPIITSWRYCNGVPSSTSAPAFVNACSS